MLGAPSVDGLWMSWLESACAGTKPGSMLTFNHERNGSRHGSSDAEVCIMLYLTVTVLRASGLQLCYYHC